MSSNTAVAHFNVHEVAYEALPEFGGSKAILYRSPDGKRLAGSFRESGTHRMTMPFDEFLYVVGGSVKISIGGGESVELKVGDCCYLRQGDDVIFEMGEGFHDVTVLLSDQTIEGV